MSTQGYMTTMCCPPSAAERLTNMVAEICADHSTASTPATRLGSDRLRVGGGREGRRGGGIQLGPGKRLACQGRSATPACACPPACATPAKCSATRAVLQRALPQQ